MVVKSKPVDPAGLDLAYLALFVGMRVNEMVLKQVTGAGFRGIRESHGYLIQHLIESDRTITELARRLGVTQQAASKTVAELIELGVLQAIPAPDRRAKRIRLSARGWENVRFARRARAGLDRRLAAAVGARSYRQAKATLVACLRELGGLERIRRRRVREPD